MNKDNNVVAVNRDAWNSMYSKTNLEYPDENLVRLFYRKEPGIPRPPAKLFEHGFGTGNSALFLAKQGYDVYGGEVNDASLKMAKGLFEANNLKGDFRLIEKFCLPYENEFFDIIISLCCVHYNANRKNVDTVNGELYRILKPGGVIILSTISREDALCHGATDLGHGEIEVSKDYRFDERRGLHLFVPKSKEHFLEVYSNRYKKVKYGWIIVNLFVPDRTLGCHMLYGTK